MFGLKLDTGLDFYVVFLIIIKCVFAAAALGHLVLAHTDSSFDKYDEKLVYWKERTEFGSPRSSPRGAIFWRGRITLRNCPASSHQFTERLSDG